MPRAAKTANGLTVKQNRFVEEYLKTGNASEAYRRAYDAKGMKAPTVNRKAKDLLDNGKIRTLLGVRQEGLQERTDITLENLTAKLLRAYDSALAANQNAAAVAAIKVIGGFHGFDVDPRANARDPFEGKSDDDLVAAAEAARAELARAGALPH